MNNNDITSKFEQDFTAARIYIPETENTPMVAYMDGEMYIKGRSLSLDPSRFYNPIISKVEELAGQGIIHTINIDMRCYDVSTKGEFKKLFQAFEKATNYEDIKPVVNWFYERNNPCGNTDDAVNEFTKYTNLPFNKIEKN